MTTSFELRDNSTKIAHEARELLNTIKADNSNAAEVEAQFETMMNESDALAARALNVERSEARGREFDTIVTEVAESATTVEGRSTNNGDEQRSAAFAQYLRGQKSLSELRAMGVSVDAKGGAVVPTTFMNRLISRLQSEGPMLDPSVVNFLVTDSGNPIEMPTFDDDKRAVIIGENTQIPEDDLEFGGKTLGAYKYTSKIFRVSNELLQDAAVDIEGILSSALAKRIGRGLNEDLTVGTGVGMPEGIVTAASSITAAAINAVTADELFALQHSIDAAYRAAAKWMFADASALKFRTMKDGQGNFVWAPGISDAQPETILGRPFLINPYMNSDFTTGKTVALFGDFKAYTVRQVKATFVRRLEERYADWDQTGYVGLARYDGKLLDASAVKALKLK